MLSGEQPKLLSELNHRLSLIPMSVSHSRATVTEARPKTSPHLSRLLSEIDFFFLKNISCIGTGLSLLYDHHTYRIM